MNSQNQIEQRLRLFFNDSVEENEIENTINQTGISEMGKNSLLHSFELRLKAVNEDYKHIIIVKFGQEEYYKVIINKSYEEIIEFTNEIRSLFKYIVRTSMKDNSIPGFDLRNEYDYTPTEEEQFLIKNDCGTFLDNVKLRDNSYDLLDPAIKPYFSMDKFDIGEGYILRIMHHGSSKYYYKKVDYVTINMIEDHIKYFSDVLKIASYNTFDASPVLA
jgi:hypothetical protein